MDPACGKGCVAGRGATKARNGHLAAAVDGRLDRYVCTAARSAEKILHEHVALGGISRLTVLIENGQRTHRQIMRAIELLGTKVAPLVRRDVTKREA